MKKSHVLKGLSACIAFSLSLSLIGCGQTDQAVKTQREMQGLTAKAEQGDAKAQFDLATRYAKGDGVEENQDTAFLWFKKAAEQGDVTSMIEVATRYSKGLGVKQESDMSKLWWRKAAEAGNSEAQYKYANKLGFSLRSSIWIFGTGETQIQNAKDYMQWLEKSAEQKYLAAQHDLGMAYLLGAVSDGKPQTVLIPKDIDKGLKYLKESADSGYYASQWAMAVLYEAGYAKIQPNKAESDKYWALLEAQTDSAAQDSIGWLYKESDKQRYVNGKNKYKGRDLTFEQSNDIALEWFQKSAAQNNKNALFTLGMIYLEGQGVFKDAPKGISYLKQAADLGDYSAMRELGFAYLLGNGTVKDYSEAYRWLLGAANENTASKWSDVHKARNAVGVLYEYGGGIDKDNVLAYAWYNIAMSGGYDKAKANLSRMEKLLNENEIREAQTLSREWKPGKSIVRASGTTQVQSGAAATNGSLKLSSVGTGFYITSKGTLLTNNHVVEGCKELKIPVDNASAKLLVADRANDLAVLSQEAKGKSFLKLSGDGAKQGEEIFVFGYPLDGFLPTSGNVTTGIVSALAGPSNNSSLIQITAPVQPGNSGGPVLDKKGNVVGVVVGKADALKVAKVTGDIPQNVNFAISDKTAKSFMDGNKVDYQTSGGFMTFAKDSVSIAELARNATVKIECWK